MATHSDEIVISPRNDTPDLVGALARYRQTRRTLEMLLAHIDQEVDRLVSLHEMGSRARRFAPIQLVDLDVCPDVSPVEEERPANTTATSTNLVSRSVSKDYPVDETLMMSSSNSKDPADLADAGIPSEPSSSQAIAAQVIPRRNDIDDALLSPGCVLGDRFELIKCVGTGGSSAVYKALDRRRLEFDDISPYVAVKVLKPRFSSSPEWLESLKREAATSQLLVHPNIIRVYDSLRDGANVYIVMEYLSGVPLTHKIRNEKSPRLPREEALKIIDAMGRALAFAHKRGIVHCDFKPANIFLLQSGDTKLIDFGISQLLNANAEKSTRLDSGTNLLNPRDLHPVTPAYASPELLDRQEPDPRDDVYSLACTTYELLTGSHPFEFRSAIEARKQNLSVERRDGLTRPQWKALVHALALKREERTSSIIRFLSELNGWSWRAQMLSKATGAALVSNSLSWLSSNYRLPTTRDVPMATNAPLQIAHSEPPNEGIDPTSNESEISQLPDTRIKDD